MTWTVIPNSDIDPDSPITTGLMTALRDNVAALANGDSGAPSIKPSTVLSDTITTSGGQSIASGTRWTPSSGLYSMIGLAANTCQLEINISGTWRLGAGNYNGLAFFDGANMRIYNGGSVATTYWHRYDG